MSIIPGALLRLGGTATIAAESDCLVRISYPKWGKRQGVVVEAECPKEGYQWTPDEPGSYHVECRCGDRVVTRYIGVVDSGWAVCQMTVGAFTAEDFSETVHNARVPVDYYITLEQATQPRWREYEQRYGDAIHPHAQADQLGLIDRSLAHGNANWDTLPYPEITRRLRGMQAWWSEQGYSPLDRIATYTPCNALVRACKEVGIRVLHSVIPEQNWSDGEWAINHWGMPTCPFWVAEDDFRKPGARSPGGVLAMTMNHYQVLLPHLTHWGDFVLSPSHFLRWHRASDSGDHPVRFEQLALDTIAMADQRAEHPLFFVAGFEFGRTFGTSKMTDFNRKGIETLISLAAEHPVVFATSRDVLAYYDRHIDALPGRFLHQRDVWAGARTMGKPGVVDDCIVIERAGYKALIRDGSPLPWLHYDYRLPWNYQTAATDVPEDWAEDDGARLTVWKTEGGLRIKAETPLPRPVPVVAWDAIITKSPWANEPVPALDNNRSHSVVEVSKGWCGEETIAIRARDASREPDRPLWWQTKTLGRGSRRRTYLHLDLPFLRDVEVPVEIRRGARIDGHQSPLGETSSGGICLAFGPHRTWHRFWGLEPDEIVPTDATLAAISALRPGIELLSDKWEETVSSHIAELHEECLRRHGWSESDILLEVACGAQLPLGSRSRSTAFDVVNRREDGLTAHEHGDGALSYGPGKSFWCHPRSLTVKIRGLDGLNPDAPPVLVLNAFDPLAIGARYRIVVDKEDQGGWVLPTDAFAPEAWWSMTIDPSWITPDGVFAFDIRCDQKGILDDWWQDRGFVAGLHGLWLGSDNLQGKNERNKREQ